MSRIGKQPITIPADVKIDIAGNQVTAKGKKGELKTLVLGDVTVTQNDGKIWVKPANDSQRAKAAWGMSRTLLSNMVVGVSQGFTEELEINGVGYRSAVDKDVLSLSLGFSHEIKYVVPKGITITVDKQTRITIAGADRQQVGQVAAVLRSLRKPEPYKGKGVKYVSETIRRKEGKKK